MDRKERLLKRAREDEDLAAIAILEADREYQPEDDDAPLEGRPIASETELERAAARG